MENDQPQQSGLLHDSDDAVLRDDGSSSKESGNSSAALSLRNTSGLLMKPLRNFMQYLTGFKSWSMWILVKLGRVSWVVGTSVLVFGIPLLIEVSREETLQFIEQQKVQELLGQGYTKMQIDNLIQSGQLGIPPPVPKPQLLE